MRIRVRLEAFCYGPAYPVRVVSVPDHIIKTLGDAVYSVLDNVFTLGQNDFQPQPLPSVSVGDVILDVPGGPWRVEKVGFKPADSAA